MEDDRIAVYSAIFGNRDLPKKIPDGPFDFYLFTDQNVELERGKVIKIDAPFGDPKRSSGWLKILLPGQLEKYPATLWVDSSIELASIFGLTDLLADADIAVFDHSERACIYDEALLCKLSGRDQPDLIEAQVDRYRAEGYPENNGLVATGGLLRRNTEAVRFFSERWWREIHRGSRRDQLSFNYVAWSLGLKYRALCPGNVWSNPWWTYVGHAGEEARPS